jgi:hypothetical protein
MRKLVISAAAACLVAGPVLAQGVVKQPRAPVSAVRAALKEGIALHAESPLRLASIATDEYRTAKFTGQVEISGTYEIEIYEEISATLWPDERSRKLLPYWDGRGELEHLSIANSEEFAKAVLSAEELAKLKSGRLALIRGQASIVADQYEASLVDCDGVSYEARFVSVQKNIELASNPGEDYGC